MLDPAEVRIRVMSVRLGGAATLVLALTGLFYYTGSLNRRGLDEAVGDALQAGEPFGLITLDLDDFKAVNDSAGHAAGDALLTDVVGSLRAVVRPGDLVGRLGGDEFAVLLPGATPAARVRERAQLALSFHVTASFGVATHPHDGASADALLHAADAQMYAAKAASPSRARARP